MNSIADTQALVDLFRQSFSPLVGLSAGRLQLAHVAAQQRYQQQEDDKRRAEILADHITGLNEQARIQAERDRQAHLDAIDLEGIRAKDELNRTMAANGGAQYWNLKEAQAARDAAAVAAARKTQAELGLSIDPTDPDYVNKVTNAAASVNAKHRQSANQIYKDLNLLNDQIGTLSSSVEVPESRAIQIARPLLIAASTDPKKAAAYKKLTSLDDIMSAAADEGAADKIGAAIQREQILRNQTFANKVRPLQSRQQQLQRTMGILEAKGISPDPDVIQSIQPSGGLAAPAEDPTAGLSSTDLSSVFPVKTPAPATGGPGFSPSNLVSAASDEGLFGLFTPQSKMRAALAPLGNAASLLPSYASRVYDYPVRSSARLLMGSDMGNQFADKASVMNLPSTLQGLFLAIKQASANGDAATAGRLRAAAVDALGSGDNPMMFAPGPSVQ